MKRVFSLMVALVILIGIFFAAGSATAGSVYDRVFFSGATNCVAIWTNNLPYSAIELLKVRVEKSLTATNVVTFKRISQSDTNNVYTNTIGAATAASGAGVQATLTAAGLKYGDIVTATGIDAATGSASNTFKAGLEFNVQQH